MTCIDPSGIPSQPGATRQLKRYGSTLRVAVRPINSTLLQFVGDHHGVEFALRSDPRARFVTDFSAERGVQAVPTADFEGRFGKVTDYRDPDASRFVLAEALDRLDRYLALGLNPARATPTFHGLLRNCECFTNHILYGTPISQQVPPLVREVLTRMYPGRVGF